jgi:hypothetical protein
MARRAYIAWNDYTARAVWRFSGQTGRYPGMRRAWLTMTPRTATRIVPVGNLREIALPEPVAEPVVISETPAEPVAPPVMTRSAGILAPPLPRTADQSGPPATTP